MGKILRFNAYTTFSKLSFKILLNYLDLTKLTYKHKLMYLKNTSKSKNFLWEKEIFNTNRILMLIEYLRR